MAAGLPGEAIRFLLGGAINTAASFVVYYVLQLFLPYQGAYAIAFVLGVLFSYRINLSFVFRARHSPKKMIAFPAVYLIQYAVSAALLAALVEWMRVPKQVAPLLVVVLTVPLTFVLARFVLRLR